MKFFVDTADVEEIRELAASGLLDGVTTNPSLVAKTGRDFFEVLEEICGFLGIRGFAPPPPAAAVFEGHHPRVSLLTRGLARWSMRREVREYRCL